MSQLFDSTIDVRSTPPSYKEGAQYVDPDTGALFLAFDNGGGGDWHPVPPIRVTQEAASFDESDLTLTHNKTVSGVGTVGLPSGYDLAGASYNQSFSVSTETGYPKGLIWNGDGTKCYITDPANGELDSYSLSTAFDISTASSLNTFSTGTQESSPTGIAWNGDGSKLFVVGGGSDSVHSYTASTLYDISTLTYSQSFDVSGQDTEPESLTFNGDGTKMYIGGAANSSVYSYILSTPYDISTASFNQSLDVSAETSGVSGLVFNGDGTKLFTTDTNYLKSYVLSTAYDISTASFNNQLDVSSQDGLPGGMAWNNDGTKVYYAGLGNDSIYSYNVPNATSGDVILEWSAPSDIQAWDLVSFQRTLDNESVTVDVEDGAGNLIEADISHNFDISNVATSKDVRLHVYLSRTNTANNPTLDYGARRYVR